MPNTLVHIGVQTAVMRLAAGRAAPFPLILAGCIIPDLPWILRRALSVLPLAPDPYLVYAYASVQASLFVSLVAALACAALFRRLLPAFAMVAAGCLLHLVLDAMQIKWGNGVTLFAPFDWTLTGWGFFWPDGPVTYALTGAGLVTVLAAFRRVPPLVRELDLRTLRLLSFAGLAALYALLPATLTEIPFDRDNHYLATLRDTGARTGKPLELDRARVATANGEWHAELFSGERLLLENLDAETPGRYSLRGTFANPTRLEVRERHYHSGYRDPASMAGLALAAAWLAVSLFRSRDRRGL